MNWTQHKPLKLGDKFTLPNHYKRRTFMQWLKRKPKELKVFEITSTVGSLARYEALKAVAALEKVLDKVERIG